jgi:2-octaprenyl-6-methoxyphenol hydroxylase
LNQSLVPMAKDVVIIGGGPIGLMTGLMLAKLNIPSYILESNQSKKISKDKRALALSNGTRYVLEQLDVWSLLEKLLVKVDKIHTSQKGTFGRTILSKEDIGKEAIAYIISYDDLNDSLKLKIKDNKLIRMEQGAEVIKINNHKTDKIIYKKSKKNVEKIFSFLILADGGKSNIEGLNIERSNDLDDYEAIVTNIKAEQFLKDTAFERFTKKGTIALLPFLNDTYGLVWTGKSTEISGLKSCSEDDFIKITQDFFGDRVGLFQGIGNRLSFKLSQSRVISIKNKNVIPVGNAAQIMSPVAGQGFNTGVQDIWSLNKIISSNLNFSYEKIAEEFLRQRVFVKKPSYQFTSTLTSIFSDDLVFINRLRGLSLSIMDNLAILKKKLVKKLSYGK